MKLNNFNVQSGEHCETTTLRNMLAHEGLVLSEAMLFGLGEGLDFQSWDSPEPRKIMPILSGRIKPGEITKNVSKNLRINIIEQEAQTPEAAYQQVVDIISQGHVAGLKLDIFYLDYFSSKRHFAAHYIALYALDDIQAHIVDTIQQGGTHVLPATSLAKARDSRLGFIPSRNLSIFVDNIRKDNHLFSSGSGSSQISITISKAIKAVASKFLSDRGPKCGSHGMYTTAKSIEHWSKDFDQAKETVNAIAHFLRYAGTGGANFRKLYYQFLVESQTYVTSNVLNRAVHSFTEIIVQWDTVIDLLISYGESGKIDYLSQASEHFLLAAQLETNVMKTLEKI